MSGASIWIFFIVIVAVLVVATLQRHLLWWWWYANAIDETHEMDFCLLCRENYDLYHKSFSSPGHKSITYGVVINSMSLIILIFVSSTTCSRSCICFQLLKTKSRRWQGLLRPDVWAASYATIKNSPWYHKKSFFLRTFQHVLSLSTLSMIIMKQHNVGMSLHFHSWEIDRHSIMNMC